jgi:hypothetical protein
MPTQIKGSPKFALQIDQSTGVADVCSPSHASLKETFMKVSGSVSLSYRGLQEVIGPRL